MKGKSCVYRASCPLLPSRHGQALDKRLSVVLFCLFCIPHHQKDAPIWRTEVFEFFILFFCIAFLRNLGILGPAVEATFKNSLLPACLAVEGEGGDLGK